MEALINKFIPIWTDYRYLIAGGVYVVWLIFCWFAVNFFDKLLDRLLKRSSSEIGDLILREAQFPLWLLLVVGGFFVVARTVGLPPKITPHVDRFTQLAIIFILIYFIAKTLLNMVRIRSFSNAALKNMFPTFFRLTNLLIWSVGILMLMDLLGISITPILASLGIAGLAIGLALQDTLGNFFAGIYILLDQPVRTGDYIELENGMKGYVENIGWRETHIKTLPNNVVVIPNSKLAQSIITNYHAHQKEMACLVQVGVSYESDLEKVEKVTIEVGQKVLQEIAGGVKDFSPFIRYHTFSDFSINFTVILRVKEFVDQYLITHEFIKALHKRYKQEGIEIPFPIRTVHLRRE